MDVKRMSSGCGGDVAVVGVLSRGGFDVRTRPRGSGGTKPFVGFGVSVVVSRAVLTVETAAIRAEGWCLAT